ncbi:hypothetical protein NP493_48g03067 [Ridgeia piscesae]|uniref:Uncharacterized protein n=1 Tax=Ridgeia piscesae TaxID=27915 RepID=A0AAD9UJI1_RIDPI|nr:hypothetical protein NP493_48g03067 [Ridgeia piscesae]
MASFTELYILQEEEKAMLKMSNMLNDQLKRLQVEELALLSEIRATQTEGTVMEINKAQKEKSEESTDINQQPLADLSSVRDQVKQQDTEEEFDSDDEQDALKSFMGSLQSNTTQ